MSRRPGGSPVRGVDALVCDLDGVVYRGKAAVPYAVEALTGPGTDGHGFFTSLAAGVFA